MTILFGTSTSPTNVLLLRHVSKIYMSIAPVENNPNMNIDEDDGK